MPSRRDIVVGGALTLIWGDCTCAMAGARPHGPGCTLEPDEADPFLNTATKPQVFDKFEGRMISSTGNREFDYALAHTLSRMTDLFGVLPGFCFYDDYDGPNAYATPKSKMRRADGTVLFGKRHFANAMAQPEHPDAVVLATCAHEFGHVVQYKHKLMPRLKHDQATTKRLELHADFLAGYFAGARKLQKPDFPAAVFAAHSFAIGDFSTAKSHHGTPKERAAAVVRGFETAYRERRSFSEAIGTGLRYVERL